MLGGGGKCPVARNGMMQEAVGARFGGPGGGVVFDLVAQLPLARWTSSLDPLLSEQLWGQMR